LIAARPASFIVDAGQPDDGYSQLAAAGRASGSIRRRKSPLRWNEEAGILTERYGTLEEKRNRCVFVP